MMPKYWYCGREMHWKSDCDFQDMGRDGGGIVSLFTCECDSDMEFGVSPNAKK